MRKAQADLGGYALKLGVTVVIVALVALVLGSIASSNTNTVTGFGNLTPGYQTTAGLILNNGTTGIGTYGSYIPIIALVLIFIVLLALIIGVYASFQSRE